MPEALDTLIRDYEFSDENRSLITFVGQVRLDPARNVVELIKNPLTGFPTTGDHYVIGPLFQPKAVRQWVGFQAFIQHVKVGLTQITGEGFRLHDGTDQFWWSGAAWVVNTVNWNTEADIANNISVFPVTARKLRPVVRLTTTDKLKTPSLSLVKVAWKAKVQYVEDIIYRGLVPALRTIRFFTDFGFTAPGGMGIDLGAVAIQTGIAFNIIDVDSVFNGTTDPERRTNLLSSFNPATKIITLSSAIPAGNKVIAMVSVEPEVAVESTSQDFTEVEKVPALVVTDLETVFSSPLAAEDAVVNKATGALIRVRPPYRLDLRFSILALTPGAVDLMRMVESLMAFAEATPMLRSPGLDRDYRLWLIDEFQTQTRPNRADLHTAQARLVIKDVLAWKRAANTETAVKAVHLTGDPELKVDVPFVLPVIP